MRTEVDSLLADHDDHWAEFDENVSYTDAMRRGIDAELDLAEQWGLFELVQDSGQKCEDTRWVFRFDSPTGESIVVQPWDTAKLETLSQDPTLKVRARLTARQYKWREALDDLFAPASSNNTQRLIDFIAVKNGWPTFTSDASRAFWQVPQVEECFVRPPVEWLSRHVGNGGDPGVIWKLKRWLYGQRRAPQHLQPTILWQ